MAIAGLPRLPLEDGLIDPYDPSEAMSRRGNVVASLLRWEQTVPQANPRLAIEPTRQERSPGPWFPSTSVRRVQLPTRASLPAAAAAAHRSPRGLSPTMSPPPAAMVSVRGSAVPRAGLSRSSPRAAWRRGTRPTAGLECRAPRARIRTGRSSSRGRALLSLSSCRPLPGGALAGPALDLLPLHRLPRAARSPSISTSEQAQPWLAVTSPPRRRPWPLPRASPRSA